MSIRDLEDYSGNLPLLDAVNRVINIKKKSDITDGVGYTIAFMMHREPSIQRLMLREFFSTIAPGANRLISDETIEDLLQNKIITLPIGIAKLVGRKHVTMSDIMNKLPTKNRYLKSLGKDIAKTLREHYEGKPTSSFIKEIWEAIKGFFDKILRYPYYQERLDFINLATDAVIRKDPSLFRGPKYKIGDTREASLLDLENAFKDNPFEVSIIKKVNTLGISLTGSTAIRGMGTIYRPNDNPMHDLDFNAAPYETLNDLTKALNSIFPNIQHFRTIKDKGSSATTETFLVANKDFTLEKENADAKEINIKNLNGEIIGKIDLAHQEIIDITDDTFQGKLLDFFIGNGDIKAVSPFGSISITVNGEDYLFSNAKNAWEAKIRYARRKDLWDWARFAPNEKYNSSNSESVRYNKYLQDGKVLDNFLNTEVGSKYIEKIGSAYRLKRGRLGYTEALDTLNFYLKTRELPSDYIGVTRDGYLYERTKAYPLKDQIEDSEDLFENATQQEQALQILDFLKEKTGLNFKFISLKEAQEKLKGKDLSDVNSFVIGNTAYFINDGGRVFNTDIAAEEMLHPFVASIRAMNSKAFYSLLKDARRAFPVLSRQIEHSYKSDVPEEIVTQALSRAFRKDFEEHPNHRAIRDLMVKFWNYVKGWFRNSGDVPILNNVDKLYAEDLSETITIQNLAEIINTEISLGNANNINRVAFNREDTENSQINIYAGTGENSELSNFAYRPFKDPSYSSDIDGKFNTVEGAFQAAKLSYTNISSAQKDDYVSKLSKASGAEARKIGRSIPGLNTEAWDIAAPEIMKTLIKASFEQNPEASKAFSHRKCYSNSYSR